MQGDVIGEDMLYDKGVTSFKVKRSVQVERALQSLNWGETCSCSF